MDPHERDDIVTIYFIRDTRYNNIQAYTDNKTLAKIYIEFYNCKHFAMDSFTNRFDKIVKEINSCIHNEIVIANINVRDPEDAHSIVTASIPITESDKRLLSSEIEEYMSARIAYSTIYNMTRFLKDKYIRALKDIYLLDVCEAILHNRSSSIVTLSKIEFDNLGMLYRTLPDNFG